MSAIGKAVTEGRLRLGYSQHKLSRVADMDRTVLHKIESGVTRSPHDTNLRKLETALGFTPGVLSDLKTHDKPVPIEYLVSNITPLDRFSNQELLDELQRRLDATQ